jgi:hypothetical protein
MEIETAARKMLMSDDTIRGYTVSEAETRVYKNRLDIPVNQTGKLALVVSRNGGWATPDEVQTLEFPILRVDAYADPTREIDGQIRILDAEDKAAALLRAADRLIHGKRGVLWGGASGVVVVTIGRWREPTLTTQEDLHGKRHDLGDSVFWRREYRVSCYSAG